jgi:hypothetical protein
MLLDTALLPMLALILVRNLRPGHQHSKIQAQAPNTQKRTLALAQLVSSHKH